MTASIKLLSTLDSLDFKVDGTALDLPAGRLGFAFGASYLHEALSAVPDANSLPNSVGISTGWLSNPAQSDFRAARSVASGFAELVVPVTTAKENIPGAHVITIFRSVPYPGSLDPVTMTTLGTRKLVYQGGTSRLLARKSLGFDFGSRDVSALQSRGRKSG